MRVEDKKLLAALLASQKSLKLDYKEIARMYGEGATYNSIEHKFRGFRKEAEVLREEAEKASTNDAGPAVKAEGSNTPSPSKSHTTPAKRGRPPKNGKTPAKDAGKTPAKKKAMESPHASDDESASLVKRQKTKSPRKGSASVDTSGLNNNASSKAANELDTLMKETGAYSVLGLGAEEA